MPKCPPEHQNNPCSGTWFASKLILSSIYFILSIFLSSNQKYFEVSNTLQLNLLHFATHLSTSWWKSFPVGKSFMYITVACFHYQICSFTSITLGYCGSKPLYIRVLGFNNINNFSSQVFFYQRRYQVIAIEKGFRFLWKSICPVWWTASQWEQIMLLYLLTHSFTLMRLTL